MTKDFRWILSPLLMIGYVCGLRIIEFPTGHPRLWFSLLYMLLLWSIFSILLQRAIFYNLTYILCTWLDVFTILLSVMFGIYNNKKFRDCMKKLTLVDDTLEKLGIKTDYYKLYRRMIWLVVGWFMIALLLNHGEMEFFAKKYKFNYATAFYICYLQNYCGHVNSMCILVFTSILGYTGLKFDQVNEYLRNFIRDNTRGIKREILHSPQRRFLKTPSNKWITWFIIHIHAELCKICREIDSIFGIEMTISVARNFGWLGHLLKELFYGILVNDYAQSNRSLFIIRLLSWAFHDTFKIFLINYVCERVSAKANATGDLLKRISYSTHDDEIRENISQFLLQITQAPVRFCGIGLFQFGFKIFRGLSKYIVTVLIILVQGYTNM